jgi:DNA-binding response OmpR family regulator
MVEGKKILYVEDEPEMIELVKLIFRRKGHTVVGALGGGEALQIVNEEKPDLVLLDLMMPDVDGWEVLRRLRAEEDFKDTPVIVVTAKSQDIDKALGLYIAEVDDYVVKPFRPGQLVKSVERVLSQPRNRRGSRRPPG